MRRSLCVGVQLCCFLFCFAAFSADEISYTYDYKGFDTNRNLLVQGVITLRVEETNKVKGEWKLQVLDKHKLKKLGPQNGSGKIVGQFKGERVFLNLNPEEFGDNIYLDGKVPKTNIYVDGKVANTNIYSDDKVAITNIFKIDGTWGRYGFFEGKLNEGKFEMVKQKDPPK